MKPVLFALADVTKMILQGKKLILAGDETILQQLPSGHWIGGTIPYFMGEQGGVLTREHIYVTELSSWAKRSVIQTYTTDSISSIFADAPVNGFSMIIIPATSAVHLSFALNAPRYDGFATRPLIGWISGVHLGDLGKISAKVFLGENSKVFEDRAVVMHVELPERTYAEINILNIFEQGSGDTITFPTDSFSATDAFINGKKEDFAKYIVAKGLDTHLPLVANYSGAMINTSFQNIDDATKTVNFYAPVFKGVEYRHAKAVGDYVSSFTSHMPSHNLDSIFFSCNCILNYLYSELEGKQTGGITGPITFGEVAYQLLNQTMAYISLHQLV